MREALRDCGSVVSLNRRDRFNPLQLQPAIRERSAAHKVIPTSCGSWLGTPDAASCRGAHARFLRALAGTLGALRRH